MTGTELFTIGHSNQPLEKFLGLLGQHGIEALVDVRRFPSSRSFPQFNREQLSAALQSSGIDYQWIEALGGRRPKPKGLVSHNTGLTNESFRNYADYMLTEEFRQGVNKLTEIAGAKRTAIMCAESVFWRCHRRLVSDFVLANGGTVQHIFPSGELKPHELTAGAKVEDRTITYPGQRMLFD
jgi:uncharacterized protein (DUF488 family)